MTDQVTLPDGGSFHIRMDLERHLVVIEGDAEAEYDMTKGLTGTELAEELIDTASGLGLDGDYQTGKHESDEPRAYDPEAAKRFFSVLSGIDRLFKEHRAALPGEPGPVQLWPHGFDLAFEWFGTRVQRYEEIEYPSQLNLGYYPNERAYFYSNPWPFDHGLVGAPLPSGAEWFTGSWEGTILYYDQLEEDPDAADKLRAYAQAVFEIASPTLMA